MVTCSWPYAGQYLTPTVEHNVGLNYGAFPKKVASSLKISIVAATQLFDRYHNELYGGITEYRENYVLPTTLEHGRIHLGLGCYIKSDNPGRDIRTLNNATCQFWSIVTALTINKIHQLIDDADLQDHIKCTSTIYDSIYFTLPADARYVKWLNDNIVPIITKDFMLDQTIHNEATGEIGPSWAELFPVRNNESLTTIQSIIDLFAYTKANSIDTSKLTKDEFTLLKTKFSL